MVICVITTLPFNQSNKLKTVESLEDAWTTKIDSLVGDNTEMGEAIDTLKR